MPVTFPATVMLAVLALPVPAAAQQVTATCTMAVTPLMFGAYAGNRSMPLDLTATVTVTCAARGAAGARVSFAVTTADGVITTRQMRGPRGMLRYQLFVDPARSLPWGDGVGGSAALRGGGTVSAALPLQQSFTVYGRVFARQAAVPAGSFQANVPVRLIW